jgi:hypothetical protein
VYALNGGTIAPQKDDITPTEEVPYYKCPSDTKSAQYQWGDYDAEPISAYDDCGTSYQMNWSWWPQTDVSNQLTPTNSSWYYRSGVLGVKLWFKMYDKQSARFLGLYEDPCDYALNQGFQDNGTGQNKGPGGLELGFHGKFSKHVGFFIDGHAGYGYMDTVHAHDSIKSPRHSGADLKEVIPGGVVGGWTAVDEQLHHYSGGRHD